MTKLADIEIHPLNLALILIRRHWFLIFSVSKKSVLVNAVGVGSSETARGEVELHMHVPGGVSLLVHAINKFTGVRMFCWQ